ncbi:L-idonate 5-dehydrogenase [Cellulomonas xylanilytica]|uniref:L-idonate 5-dehydrogenase n=1 Tax=Cellulomonas xylanilytica TaxID=233583 RepID=A0A510V0V5_9CELL|nr:L-idonate 5-dehydrogenase [Cellulomonas xylanilytica]GEK20527.1 L-idonate 5-dehydrogenase [Cellulomonas xylanilytica]
MRALVIRGTLDLVDAELPTPEPGPGEVRLRMAYGGICGSDLHYWAHGANAEYVLREPLVPGHEVSGTVDLDPRGDLAVGTPVVVHPARFGLPQAGLEASPHLWPGGSYLGSAATWPHTQGGMSEYLVVRQDMVRPLPADLPLRRAALAEPLAVALHAMTVAGDVAGARVLVSGCGPIGLLAVAAARRRGAAEIVAADVLAGPLSRAVGVGADATVQVGAEALPDGVFDVVLECSGVPAAIGPALRGARRRGVVVQVGMVPDEPRPVNLAALVSRELQLRGTFRFHDEIDEAIRMLTDDVGLEAVITHELPADQAEQAFRTAQDSEASGKVLVRLWHDGELVGDHRGDQGSAPVAEQRRTEGTA